MPDAANGKAIIKILSHSDPWVMSIFFIIHLDQSILFPPIQFHTYKRHTVMYVYVVYINFVPAEVPILSAPALIIASKSSLVLTPPLAFTFT